MHLNHKIFVAIEVKVFIKCIFKGGNFIQIQMWHCRQEVAQRKCSKRLFLMQQGKIYRRLSSIIYIFHAVVLSYGKTWSMPGTV